LNATDLTVINKFFYEQTDSTNIRAKEFACSKKNENPQEEKNLLPIKAIFVANSQTAGKGRLGRSFFRQKIVEFIFQLFLKQIF
jgi:biotin-(acetyl-CoA carboxylase) ligase